MFITVKNLWNLREAHDTKNFDKIDYCKDCDFLYQDPEILYGAMIKLLKLIICWN